LGMHAVTGGSWAHGRTQNELVPRLVETLVGKKVVGASMGGSHTVAWIETGELFTFGSGADGETGPQRGRG
jgi:alpha-tubulin suppressor-like RCC1 family protein